MPFVNESKSNIRISSPLICRSPNADPIDKPSPVFSSSHTADSALQSQSAPVMTSLSLKTTANVWEVLSRASSSALGLLGLCLVVVCTQDFYGPLMAHGQVKGAS